MQIEHCSAYGHDKEFTTPNYNVTTTPEKEWGITVHGETTQNMVITDAYGRWKNLCRKKSSTTPSSSAQR